ncbi:uncharacterized protein MELLADRAFT_95010 [Melampsora larici-populina 98AG31]|uniref:Uncharacterized protein n=1 Tax=Melampsora larici-populina (strain 98AG31 / pathotype 3-4-7) TaxID=747676 RepID=F4S8T0_MELLP|nr:uncharacterized protein MELLADRAFT_95010 [Melampsora larici-populina 98AG31]EGF98949.1 hypothetical protein MELLADRAFT_95010 [Melampsora larici-populina 98AG31]
MTKSKSRKGSLKSPGASMVADHSLKTKEPTSPTPNSTQTAKDPSTSQNPQANFSNLFNHPLWPKVQTLPKDLHVFLEIDFESMASGIKNLNYYRVLAHFNPETKSRPTHNKAKLTHDFMTDLRPLLEPFLIRTSVPPSDTLKPDIDFDPLSRHTTRAMLCDAIHSRCPGVTIRQDARVDQVLVLYKAHVDPDLVLPFSKEFSCKPKTLAAGKAHKKTIEFLRFSLQCHAPYIFVHSVGLVHPVLVDLYIKFVCEEDVPEGRVISGYHYSQVSDLMPSVDMQE